MAGFVSALGVGLGAFVAGVIFADKVKAFVQAKVDAVKAKFTSVL